jgi:hypothetical protein
MADGKLYWTETNLDNHEFHVARLDIKDRVKIPEREKID